MSVIAIMLSMLVIGSCESATEPPVDPFPEEFTLVRYNGSVLPYSGIRQSGPGSPEDPTHCYEVVSGVLSMRNGDYSLRVDGREDQYCRTGWRDKVVHSGTAGFNIVGDSIHFQMSQGLGAFPSGHISGDTVVMVLRPVQASAGYGVRTLAFVPR
ncbi:MAG TPA: hypothetical protein VMN60_11055 [Longimicrobiales bacterium]|nr:hypothetical protein [Longimicrobiales bacterium]